MTIPMRPDVYLSERSLPNVEAGTSRVARAAFIGASSRGPVVPTLVTSFSQYMKLFGTFAENTGASQLPYALSNFFANGGRTAYVCRLDNTNAVDATVTLDDNAATPADHLVVTAANYGVWGNSLSVQVVPRGTRYDLVVLYQGNVVERFTDLSSSSLDSRYVVAIVNSVITGSSYIAVALAVGANPLLIPVASSPVSLATGTNGTLEVSYADTIPLLDGVLGPFVLNLPSQTLKATIDAAIAYAETRGDVFVVVDSVEGNDVAATVALASTYTVSSYAAVYYPWVSTLDPGAAGGGSVFRWSPPGGAVVGVIVRTDAERGVFKTPAGVEARIFNAADVKFQLTNDERDTLNEANVNAIIAKRGRGIVVFGGRTLKKTAIDRYIAPRRSLIFIKEGLKDISDPAIFESNDDLLWEKTRQRITRFLTEFWEVGGLKGSSADRAFYVKIDADNNPAVSVNAGELNVEVGVALQTPAEFVIISVGHWDGGTTVTEQF